MGEEKTGKIASFRGKGWGGFAEDKYHPQQASGMIEGAGLASPHAFRDVPSKLG